MDQLLGPAHPPISLAGEYYFPQMGQLADNITIKKDPIANWAIGVQMSS